MHALSAQTSVAAPASSPKLHPKKRNPAAEAIAYAQDAPFEIPWLTSVEKFVTAGRPMRKKASAKKSHGIESTVTDGRSRKSAYQTNEKTRKIWKDEGRWKG